MVTLKDSMYSEGKNVEIYFNEIAIMKQLIKESSHSLALLRELISNAGAVEVGATEIKIKYTVDEEGHIFEVIDNGCGMDYLDYEKNKLVPGRLDRFIGLGLSGIVGIKSDEFSWKGLGSKLAYRSKKVEVDTWNGTGKAYKVTINEPWSSIERNLKPRPQIFAYQPEDNKHTGTSIKVYGYPEYRKDQPFTVEEIKNFLSRRTFIGYTRERKQIPKIYLSVLGQIEELKFGFPELKITEEKKGTVIISESQQITKPGNNDTLNIQMKGFYTWDPDDYGLDKNQLNTGLILSVKGIPYFNLDMEEYGSRSLKYALPGVQGCCFIAECDLIGEEMNIARSALNASGHTELFKKGVKKIFSKIESSQKYLDFRNVIKVRKAIGSADELGRIKKKLQSDNQKYVIFQSDKSKKAILLCREPEYESDVLCLIWKLETINGLPFKKFHTLAYVGSGKKGGPDILADFQEDPQSEPEISAAIEIENNFYNYIPHGHNPSQFPKVICWEISKTRKVKVDGTEKAYKYIAVKDAMQIYVYCLRQIEGIKVVAKKDLEKYSL